MPFWTRQKEKKAPEKQSCPECDRKQRELIHQEEKSKQATDRLDELVMDSQNKENERQELEKKLLEKENNLQELQKNLLKANHELRRLQDEMENNKTMAFLPKEELVHLQEQSKEQKRSRELAELLKEKLAKAQESLKSAHGAESAARKAKREKEEESNRICKELEDLKQSHERQKGELKARDKELAALISGKEDLNSQLEALTQEKDSAQEKIKALESEIESIQQMTLHDKISALENELREQRRKNRELKKQLEAAKAQNAVVDDGVDKDAEIETLKREVLELQYRMKDESERYESQWEDAEAMHQRQLRAMREAIEKASSSGKGNEDSIKRLRQELQKERESNRQRSDEISDLKSKNREFSRKATDIERIRSDLASANDSIKQMKLESEEEKRNNERIIFNLRGHMLNIYTGNVSDEMARMLDIALELESKASTARQSLHLQEFFSSTSV